MKALENLNNTEKARLLHDVFPAEIPLLLENLKAVCKDLEDREAHHRESWDFGLVSFDQWLRLARQTAELIRKHELSMKKSSRVFSDQLTFGYEVLFVNDRIIKYAQRVSTSEKFKSMIQVLYT